MLQENAEAIAEALDADLGKPKLETYLEEVCLILDRAMICAEKLEGWAKPEMVEVPEWQKVWSPTIYKASKGTALIIA